MFRVRRRLGTALIVLGVLALGYGAAVYFWKDPVTDLYARWKQHQLSGQLEESFEEYRLENGLVAETSAAQTDAPAETVEPADAEQSGTYTADVGEQTRAREEEIRRAAARYYRSIEPGQALGRIVIPKLGIDPVFVNGTKWGRDLSRGPGRYPETKVPGLGELTAIAGHRTTFGAPFRHIDDLKRGDEIRVELPYGTFLYRVTGHEIVDDEDWSVIDPRGFDTLVLSACHPLYSAKQRWIVYAKLVKVDLPDGESYRPGTQTVAAGA
jgi:sortase A